MADPKEYNAKFASNLFTDIDSWVQTLMNSPQC